MATRLPAGGPGDACGLVLTCESWRVYQFSSFRRLARVIRVVWCKHASYGEYTSSATSAEVESRGGCPRFGLCTWVLGLFSSAKRCVRCVGFGFIRWLLCLRLFSCFPELR